MTSSWSPRPLRCSGSEARVRLLTQAIRTFMRPATSAPALPDPFSDCAPGERKAATRVVSTLRLGPEQQAQLGRIGQAGRSLARLERALLLVREPARFLSDLNQMLEGYPPPDP